MKIRLVIGSPTTGATRIEWTETMVELVKALLRWHDKKIQVEDVVLLYYCSSVIPENRHQIVYQARKWKATHILWVDDDMSFHPDVVKVLLKTYQAIRAENPKDYPRIIGANCIKRMYPLQYMAVGFNDREILSFASKGITEVRYTGNAFLLTEMEVYDKLSMPWFAFPWIPHQNATGTEDVFFMDKAREELGYGTYVIHELGEHIDHTGVWTFKPSDRFTNRLVRWGHPDVPSGLHDGGAGTGDRPVEGGRDAAGGPAVEAGSA